MSMQIPYGRQSVSEEDVQAVAAVLRSDYLTQGPTVEEFERALCAQTGAAYCVAVANGTAALHLAVAALELPPGSAGLTSPITFAASANCMAYCGCVPRFADIDEETFCLSPRAVEKELASETRLLVPVHFAGRTCDMPALAALARPRGLRIIEDAAHAIGSEYPGGGRVGDCRHADLTIFSFHPVKTITTGEGGAVTTNDPKLYERLKLLRSHGITKDAGRLSRNPGPWYYEMQALGFNYRLTDLQAALGLSQLKRLGAFKSRRLEIVRAYNRAFRDLPWLKIPCERDEDRFCYHLYVARLDWTALGRTRAEAMAELRARNVLTQVHYIPVHLQPFYRTTYGTREGQFPAAEAFYEQALSLPLYPAMSDEDVARVVAAVRALKNGAGRGENQ
jgi:UDP-4-amino-4,6-dideoxy-N-acetyl-beta-L-altrosamine transaminase